MASLRMGYGLPARPSDGYRPRRMEDVGEQRSIPRPLNRGGKKETELPQPAKQGPSHLRLASRVPQPSSRRPSLPQPVSKTVPDRHSRSWGSTSTAISGSHAQTESGSSSSGRSYEDGSKPQTKVLRRKKSSVAAAAIDARNDSPSASSPSPSRKLREASDRSRGFEYDRALTESPAEIRVAEMIELPKTTARSPAVYPELDRYRDFERPTSAKRQSIEFPYHLSTHDLPPPTPASLIFSGNSSQVSGFSGSPSTRLSESPGPGPYSRDTTPTSMSSQSPSFVAPNRVYAPTWNRQNIPAVTRPPVTRRRAGSIPNEVDTISADPHGLAAVRESLTSSSSNSTVRDGDKNAKGTKNNRPRLLPPPPPSPPPRKSSQKFRKNKDEKQSPVKPAKDAHQSAKTSLSPPALIIPRSQQSSPLKPSAPRRPSRDGISDIDSHLLGPVPIIQSNLSSASRMERRGSEPAVPSAFTKSATPIPQTRNASTSNLPIGKDQSSAARLAEATPGSKILGADEAPKVAQAASSNSGSSFNSRFAFFRRKTAPDTTSAAKKKLSRKGPVAGTGHEGYGRVGAARRRSSSGSNFGRTSLEASQENFASSDPFLADRVNPVVIAGGEIIENRNASAELTRTEVNQGIVNGRPSTDSKTSSEMSSVSSTEPRTALWPSAIPRGHKTTALANRRPSESSDSDGPVIKSTIAFRRSVQRLRSSPDSPLRLPHPINTTGATSSPMTSFDTSIMSDESVIELQQEVSRGSSRAHPTPKKLKKRAPSPRKWNLFGRSQNKSDSKKNENNEQVAATVTIVEKRPIPFYAIMDSPEQENTDAMDVQDALRFADVYTHSSVSDSSEGRPAEFKMPDLPATTINRSPQNSLSTSPQKLAAQPALQIQTQQLPGTLTSGRRSRLPQVGRIPQVVSKRVEKPSPRSFSRPFRASLQLPNSVVDMYDAESIAKGPTPPKSSSPVRNLDKEASTAGGVLDFPLPGPALQSSPEFNDSNGEFIAFSPRKYSDATIGTSSSSGCGAFAAATAIIPNPDDPPAEDEVWDEYDDLLGDDGMKIPQSATSSKGIPFHLETYHSKLDKEEETLESPTIVADARQESMHSMAPTRSSTCSADMADRIRAAFQPHPSPTGVLTASESSPSHDTQRHSQEADKAKLTGTQSRRSSNNTRISYCSSSSSEDTSPLAQVNLRVGSMTVSKWLTFGHVLFSDIRHELVSTKGQVKESLSRQSILVVDGLGNDDWSFYAAETYPAANFFNLSPRAPLPTDIQNSPSTFPLSPPNHHQIQYVSHLDKFPFAPQSFTSVVYRFPVAAPESYYRNILAEARRVLKPGGFIELSILDVDLNNMGNRGRRTVRQLKERIHETTPETSLGSTADLIVRLLGKVGFSNIKAANVGVPVASSVTRTATKLAEGRSSIDKPKTKKDPPSLAEMMSDKSDTADASITNMVAKVGRWWYTRCYESTAGPPSDGGIWNDKALLSECEEMGTSLKLMVCCARAPDRITSY